MSWLWNRILGNGEAIYLGEDGGDLLLGTGNSPGAMTLEAMQNKVWHLLRENGPSNGFPPPTEQSDFTPSTVAADLNNAIAQFISDTGLSASISDRKATIPVIPFMDYPIPPGCVSLQKIEYTMVGQGVTYSLPALSLQGFDNAVGGVINPSATGVPRFYREVYAGQVRLWPPPGPGQAASASIGSIDIAGTPTAGDLVTLTILVAGVAYQFFYTAEPGDNSEIVASSLVAQINANTNLTTYLNATVSYQNGSAFQLFVGNLTPVVYDVLTTSTTLYVEPTAATQTVTTGDTMTWYFQTNGTLLVNPGDQPGIPDNFHIALCYRVLSDYWDRKNDPGQSDRYLKKYGAAVQQGKALKYDANQDSQPTIAGGEGNYGSTDYIGTGWY